MSAMMSLQIGSTGPKPEMALVAAVAAVAVTTAAVWLGRRQRAGTKQFHMEYPPPPQLPLVVRLITRLPQRLRRSLALAMQKPKPPLDGVDLMGPDHDPYQEIRQLVPKKIWRVRYQFAPNPDITDALKDIYGLDLSDPVILDNVPEAKKAQLQACMDAMDALERRNRGLTFEEQQRNKVKMGYQDSQDMLVARLENDEQGLLLYNPCRMHDKIKEWLNELGTVKYIVSGSSSHTNQLPQAAIAFPNAKIVCSEAADAKCTCVGMRPADFVYTNRTSYQAAVQELQTFGIQLFYIAGDVMTQSLLVLAYNHLFDTDLTSYGNGHRWLHLDQSDWDDSPKGDTATWFTWANVFYYASTHCSCVAGYIPNYRIIGMDPSSDIGTLMLDEPNESSCLEMAESLRGLLAMEFLWVDNVHSKKRESLSAEEFRKCIKASWSWLDEEKSL